MSINRLDDHRDQAGAWDIIEGAHGHLAFDIGGNVGQAARVLSQHFATVVSCEPCVEAFDILLVESAPNVVPLPVAVSSEHGTVTLTESEFSISTGQLTTGAGLAWGKTVGARTVDAVTLDELIDHYGEPQFVKIDTEGHEVAVLEGWTHPKCAALIEVHRAEHEAPIRAMWPGPLRKLIHERRVGPMAYHNHFWLTTVGVA